MARLIQKIYNVDPLLCPKRLGSMRIISFIEDDQLVKKILEHLDLWEVRPKPSPRANDPPTEAFDLLVILHLLWPFWPPSYESDT